MIARIHKSMEKKDEGFTLIELLVVMIIIGILAAIAIPIFLNQRKKANDSAATSDVSTIGKEVATYYVDATAYLPTTGVVMTALGTAGGRYQVNSVDVGKVSNNITSVALTYPAGTPTSAQDGSTKWCVTIGYDGGTRTNVFYSANNGLSTTGC
ncbi:MAG TPA: prepilin-type N-terminal cleavage/methylation domain-containing protein [Propionicimonas sp.]|jgi:prepilin-type N-terminal cleavage/methylation domain-containing protein